jgi:hypothetical protein
MALEMFGLVNQSNPGLPLAVVAASLNNERIT